MKVLHANVLVEETLTKKDSKVIISLDEKPDNETVYTPTFKILDFGPEVDSEIGLKKGDVPCFASWGTPVFVKIVEGKPGDAKLVRHAIYDVKSIVAID